MNDAPTYWLPAQRIRQVKDMLEQIRRKALHMSASNRVEVTQIIAQAQGYLDEVLEENINQQNISRVG